MYFMMLKKYWLIYSLPLKNHRASLVARWSRIHLQCRRPQVDSWVRKVSWRRATLPTPVFLGFPGGSAGKESACNVGDLGLIPGLGRYPGEGNGYPLQYSGLENSVDCMVHGVTKSWTQLSNFHLKKHGFEMYTSTYMWIFFNKYYSIHGWLNPWIWNHKHRSEDWL